MTTDNLSLFKAMSAKMHYLEQRHRIIAQNVANADTPGYQPRDLKKVDFSEVMQNIEKSNNVLMDRTEPGHMSPYGNVDDPKKGKQKQVFEVAPDGNAVVMEEQMLKSSKNNMDYNLMTTLYQKNASMIRTAIGSN